MTLLQITETIRKISLNEPNIQSFVGEFLDLNSVDAEYGAIILQQRTHRRDDEFITYSFYLGYADRLNEDKSNEVEIQSTGIQVIDNIVYSLENRGIDTSVGSYNTFTQRFLAEAAGTYVELNIQVPVGECEDDFSDEKLELTITENGSYNYIPDGLGFQNVKLNVVVPGEGCNLGEKLVKIDTPQTGRTYSAVDDGYDGYEKFSVVVNVPIYHKSITITENGSYGFSSKDDGLAGYDEVAITANVKPKLQSLVLNPYPSGVYNYTPDDGYDGFSRVSLDTEGVLAQGREEGITEQKSKLTDISITENGTYEKEDGYKSVVVNVPSGEYEKYMYENFQCDEEGLASLNWDEESIKYFKYNTPNYAYSSVSDANKALTSEITYATYKNYYNNTDLVYFPYFSNKFTNSQVFKNFFYIEGIPLLDFSGVTSFASCFYQCYKLKTIPPIDTSSGTDFQYMFFDNYALMNIPELDFSKGVKCNDLFEYCTSLTGLPTLDFSSATTISGAFNHCEKLETIPNIITSSGCTDVSWLFCSCYELKSVPLFDTSGVTSVEYMFKGAKLIKRVPDFDFSSISSAAHIFQECAELKEVTNLDFSNVMNMSNAFQDCITLETVKLSIPKCVEYAAQSIFSGCSILKNIEIEGALNTSINLYNSSQLTYESIKSLFTAASQSTYSGTELKTLTFNQSITDQNKELTNLLVVMTDHKWVVNGLSIN